MSCLLVGLDNDGNTDNKRICDVEGYINIVVVTVVPVDIYVQCVIVINRMCCRSKRFKI